jgi:hypothetical protein
MWPIASMRTGGLPWRSPVLVVREQSGILGGEDMVKSERYLPDRTGRRTAIRYKDWNSNFPAANYEEIRASTGSSCASDERYVANCWRSPSSDRAAVPSTRLRWWTA